MTIKETLIITKFKIIGNDPLAFLFCKNINICLDISGFNHIEIKNLELKSSYLTTTGSVFF